LTINITMPKIEKCPKKNIVFIKRVEFDKMPICQYTGFSRTLAKTVLIRNRVKVGIFFSIRPSNIRQ